MLRTVMAVLLGLTLTAAAWAQEQIQAYRNG